MNIWENLVIIVCFTIVGFYSFTLSNTRNFVKNIFMRGGETLDKSEISNCVNERLSFDRFRIIFDDRLLKDPKSSHFRHVLKRSRRNLNKLGKTSDEIVDRIVESTKTDFAEGGISVSDIKAEESRLERESRYITEEDIFFIEAVGNKLQKNPDDEQALTEKGFLYIDTFLQPKEALTVLSKIVERNNANVDALFWLAKTLYHDHFKNQEAKETLEAALHIDFDRADCHDLLASVLHDLGEDAEKSIAHLQKAIELEPEYLWSRLALGYYLCDQNNLAQAKQTVVEAIEVFKNIKVFAPASPIEDYYEECISGRTTIEQEDFNMLLAKIKEKQITLRKG